MCSQAQADPFVHGWSAAFGPGSAQSVAVDDSGHVFIAGWFGGTVNFGGGNLTSAGSWDIYVAKFDADGNHIWSASFGDVNDEYAYGLALDDLSNVILTGWFIGTVDFGGGVLTSAGGFGDIYVVKFDAGGNHIWSARFGDADDQYAYEVAADPSGNVIVVGHFDGTVDFGGGALANIGGLDMYIAKFDVDGSHVWSHSFAGTGTQWGQGVAVDSAGKVALTGYADGSVDFGGGVLTSSGSYDVVVAKFDADGNHLWSGLFGDFNAQYGRAVTMDDSGNVVVTGSFRNSIDFGAGPMNTPVPFTENIFVVKFTTDGNHVWSHRFGDGTAGSQVGRDVVVDDVGNIIVTGAFAGTVDFGGGPFTAGGFGSDMFVARFTSAGSHYWSQSFGYSNADEEGRGVAVGESQNLILTGYANSGIDFGGGTVFVGVDDIFVAKLLFTLPYIDAVEDVPNDQGGSVSVRWKASIYDVSPERQITHYSVWRATHTLPSSMLHGVVPALVEPADIVRDFEGPGYRVESSSAYGYYWEWMTNVTAYYFGGYEYTTPTLYDSTASDAGMHYFQVLAHTGDQFVFYTSPVDSGYSVDNIAPGMPRNFGVAYNTGSGNWLAWDPPDGNDYEYYRVYRSTDPNFIPSLDDLIYETATTSWSDSEYDGWDVTYKITAVDGAGNESPAAEAGNATAIPEPVITESFVLHQNVPNPFNPRTQIRYNVPPDGGHVTLQVYDAGGRLVRTLIDGYQPPGQQRVLWDGTNTEGRELATGIYFYRMTAPGFTKTRKMVLLK
jgi:hypothetical protein